jgi:hypothetical protein
MEATGPDGLREVIVSVPRSGWVAASLGTVSCLLALSCASSAVFEVHQLFGDRSGAEQGVLSPVPAVVFVLGALVNGVIFWLVWRRPFMILRAGIEYEGHFVAWRDIILCRWTYYSPGTLIVIGPRRVCFLVWIPKKLRTEVEGAVRLFGKWKD